MVFKKLPLAHDIRRLPLDLFRIDNKTKNGRRMREEEEEEETCSFVAADCPEGPLSASHRACRVCRLLGGSMKFILV